MILTQLNINDFRNIQSLALSPHPSLNLLTGQNGSGKSSILEAIHSLSTGHSFRTRLARELIRRDCPQFSVTAQFTEPRYSREHRAGLLRHRDGAVDLRLNYESIQSVATLTKLLPVKALTPDSHKLIQDGPGERRQYLDWGVFHMEHSFFDVWKQFKRSLSQRNQVLRQLGSDQEINTWNPVYVEAAVQLDKMRQNYVQKLSVALSNRLQQLEATFHVELQYRCGWKEENSLETLMSKNIEYHRRMKTTTDGPHRAELIIHTDGIQAKQLLSRGQQKVLVYLMHLSQLDLLSTQESRHAIVLCDDLTSELDVPHAQRLINQLVGLAGQVFVTGVNLDVLADESHSRFHMEHGVVEKVV